MAGSSRNSKATSSRSSKRSECLSSSIRTIQGVARPIAPLFGSNECGNRHEPRRFTSPDVDASAHDLRTSWKIRLALPLCTAGCPRRSRPTQRAHKPNILHEKRGNWSARYRPLYVRSMETNAGGAVRKQTLTSWHLKRPRVMVDGPPILAKVRAPTERCLSKIAH
jgi:hypothetical protein